MVPVLRRPPHEHGKLAKNFEQLRHTTTSLEILPYSLGAASLAIFDLGSRPNRDRERESSGGKARNYFGSKRGTKKTSWAIGIDSFMDDARRAQNAQVVICSESLRDGVQVLEVGHTLVTVGENRNVSNARTP